MIRIIVFWLFLISKTTAQNCQQTGCAPGYCCSKWGFCGNTQLHCQGSQTSNQNGPTCNPPCQPGNCCSQWGFCGNTPLHCANGASTVIPSITTTRSLSPATTTNTFSPITTPSTPSIASTPSIFPTINTPGTAPTIGTAGTGSTIRGLTTRPLIDPPPETQNAALLRQRFDCIFDQISPSVREQRWQGYQEATSLTSFAPQNVEELMIFFAHASHETDGLRTYEQYCGVSGTCADDYQQSWCSPVQGESSKKYYGRGWFQLSWPCNYNAAGKALGVDLLKNPEKVAESDTYAAATAMWFWKINNMSEPARNGNFGETTKIINPIECGALAKQSRRIEAYQKVRQCFGFDRATTNLSC